jgi:aminopeptidase N
VSTRHGLPLLILVLVFCLGAPPAGAAPFKAGSRSLGDPLLPQLGNGGYDARHYDIDLDYDPVANRFESAVTTMKARATQSLSEFSLDFQDLAVREVRVNGRRARFEQVEATPDLSGDPSHSQPMKLVVEPRDGIRKGRKFRVTVDYSGAEPQVFTDPDGSVEGWVPGCFTPTGGTRTCNSYYVVGEPIGSQAWFPSNNYPTEKASFDTDITVPNGKVAFGVGELKGDAPRNNGDGTSTWRWREDDPTATYLVTASNGDFDYEETTAGGLPFYSAIDSTGTPEQKAAVKATLARTDEMMDFLAERYGPYPFDSNGALVDRTTGIGYALEVQGKSHYPGNNAGPRLSDSTQLHEISHQWFGNSATLQAWNDIWFNEGWAQWSEWSFSFESGEDPASPADQFQANYDAATAEDWSMAPTELDGDPANLFAFFPTYVRGAMTLEGYRQIVGDARFFRLARRIQSRYRFDNVSTAEFIREAVRASGLGGAERALLRDYFQQWLYGTVKPTILPADFG